MTTFSKRLLNSLEGKAKITTYYLIAILLLHLAVGCAGLAIRYKDGSRKVLIDFTPRTNNILDKPVSP